MNMKSRQVGRYNLRNMMSQRGSKQQNMGHACYIAEK